MSRLDVRKTYKLYIGGAFVRSESGRSLPAMGAKGEPLDNYPNASRKDLRDAVVAARGAFEGWAKKTPYLRGQILYRAAEMLQGRRQELADEVSRSLGVKSSQAEGEVDAAIDRLVYFAGWTDKYSQIFGTVNPVASPHFNFTVPEPTGVVVIFAPDEPPLLPLVTLMAATILSGNAVVLVPSEKFPLPALTFAEILATSDLPGGVVNLITARRSELLGHVASHMDINAVIDGTGLEEVAKTLQGGAAHNLKRYASRALPHKDWFSEKAEDPYWILDAIEFKTAWHPMGV